MGINGRQLKVAFLWALCLLYVLILYVISITWLWPFMDDYWNIIQFGLLGLFFLILEIMTILYLRIERMRLHKEMVDAGLIKEKPAAVVAVKSRKSAADKWEEEIREALKEDPDFLDEMKEKIKEEGG